MYFGFFFDTSKQKNSFEYKIDKTPLVVCVLLLSIFFWIKLFYFDKYQELMWPLSGWQYSPVIACQRQCYHDSLPSDDTQGECNYYNVDVIIHVTIIKK